MAQSEKKISESSIASMDNSWRNRCAGQFITRLFRKKRIDFGKLCDTKLARCLNLFDLTALGIGSTLGAGIYVVAGSVAKEVAGPAVIFSFLIAAIASVFAGLCYAEFGARVPKTGSAYVYSYVTVGEIWAFIIGWNLILEYMIGAASVARAWSATLDAMTYKRISNALRKFIPISLAQLSEYPDFLALAITIFSTLILIVGVKSSSRFNNVFTMLNIVVVLFVIVSGVIKGDLANWRIDPYAILAALTGSTSALNGNLNSSTLLTQSSSNTNATTLVKRIFNVTGEDPSTITKQALGQGGFFPFGFSGVLSGAATCFYAFIGFDAIATTGEEVKNPQKTLPISIILALTSCFLAYVGISAALTLMMPYYLLDSDAPIPFAFSYVGWNKVKIIIAVGSMCGLSTSLMGSMFPLPRVIYAMASDGLLFRFLAKVNPRLKTPIYATVFAGTFAGVMAMLFDLKELVDMMSIGTLLAYTLVAICILLLRLVISGIFKPKGGYFFDRYRPNESCIGIISTPLPLMPSDEIMLSKDGMVVTGPNTKKLEKGDDSEDYDQNGGRPFVRRLFFPRGKASKASAKVVTYATTVMSVCIILFNLILVKAESYVLNSHIGSLISLIVLGVFILLTFYIILIQPQNNSKLNFKVPWVPLIPFLSIFINMYLMMKLGVNTWIRFSVWMTAGFLIYFFYGIRHSSEKEITLVDETSDFVSKDEDAINKKRMLKTANKHLLKSGISPPHIIQQEKFMHDSLDDMVITSSVDEDIGHAYRNNKKRAAGGVNRVETQLTLVPSELDMMKRL